MFPFTKEPNPEAAVYKFLKALAVKISADAISAELEKHPNYPSLLAISDVLTTLNIENDAFQVEYERIANVPCPFIAHTNLNNGDFLVIHRVDNENILVSSEKWNRHKLSREEFKNTFSGVVLTAAPITGAKKTTTIAARLPELKTPALIVGLALILLAALIFNSGYFAKLNLQTLLLTLVKTAGLITSVLLLVQSIDGNNPLVQILCRGGGKTNCNAILSSKAAKVPINIGIDGLSWSEVGFFYFAGTWLLLLFGGASSAVWQVLFILNVISLPYTVYSIYYQARVARQWCVLCCTVQALLWLEFFVTFSYIHNNSLSFVHGTPFGGEGWGGATWGTLIICLVSPFILWLLLKPLLLKLQQLRPLKDQLRKFKYNNEFFSALLIEQPKYSIPNQEWAIALGNLEADNIITMVTNPYCAPCAKTHMVLDELLQQRIDLQARIVFTANNLDNDLKTPISRHLMALNSLPDKTIVKKALFDWYEQKQKNYEIWANAYPIEFSESEHQIIDRQYAWCQIAEVTATPTILFNGYRLPELYGIADLKYILK